MSSRGDAAIEGLAQRIERAAGGAAAEGGLKAKLAEPLAEDAAFLRQLKPSLIRARMRGTAPTDAPAGSGSAVLPPRPAPSGPQLGARPGGSSEGPNPFVVIGAAFALGMLLAKMIDWRGHAHPRR